MNTHKTKAVIKATCFTYVDNVMVIGRQGLDVEAQTIQNSKQTLCILKQTTCDLTANALQ